MHVPSFPCRLRHKPHASLNSPGGGGLPPARRDGIPKASSTAPRAPGEAGKRHTMSTIQEFFTGKTVLVTGATGFLGKALLEKILRSLPTVRRLYLLVRPKERASRTVSADDRFWGEVLKSSIFDRLKRELGDGFDAFVEQRVAVLNGDLTDERLGVSDEDYRRLCDEVEVIINSAAVVVFDERLDLSLNLNTLGARRMMDVARDCRRLQAVIHISTCYVSGTRKGWVAEEVSESPFDVEAEATRLQAECAAIKERCGTDRE